MSESHHPHTCQNLIPYLHVRDGGKMIDFYQRAFGAETKYLLQAPDGQYMHVQMQVEGSTLMFSSMCPEGMQPEERKPTTLPTVTLMLYVKDCDAMHDRAVAAGAKSLQAPADMFYGDRNARLLDPAGIVWIVATSVEILAPEEVRARAEKMFRGA